MTIQKWHHVSESVQYQLKREGFLVETRGEYPFQEFRVFASDEEVEAIYDWLTGQTEHLSNPRI